MLPNNKNIKDQRIPRTARLRYKIQTINQHSQQFNQFYFMVPEVQTVKNVAQVNFSPFKVSHDTGNNAENNDSRRNTIKEKIKFRIKQELWNLVKKHNDRQEQNETHSQNQSIDQKPLIDQTTFSCVKGKTFTRFDRDSFHSKKNWSMVAKTFRQEYDRSKTERQKSSQEQGNNRRRFWSSVKMENEKALLFKKSNLQKLELMQIQPWKSPDDSENHFLD